MLEEAEMHKRFGYHALTVDIKNQIQEVRPKFRELAEQLDKALPEGCAKDVALKELESSMIWAIKSITDTSAYRYE